MPVLVNAQNQLAEDLPQEQADLALQQGTHELPLNDPEGNAVTARLDQAQNLLSQGYTQPEPQQLESLMNYAKYSEPSEQVKTALESAASGATFGISTGVERALGVSPEDITARREVNPNIAMAGEAAGLLGSLATGVGEGALVSKVGQAVGARLLGETFLAKVGSTAARNAVETALVASGNEVSKMLSSDPEQSAQSAMVNIGLNSLLGGGIGAAFGVAPALWKLGSETKVGQFLDTITKKANGLEKSTLPSPEIQNALNSVGVDIPNELKAALSENPEARGMFQALQESTTKAGKEAQEAYYTFKNNVNQGVLKSLGKTEADIDAISSASDFESGKSLKDSLEKQVKNFTDPVVQKFENVKDKFSQTELTTADLAQLGNDISQMAHREGYGILKGTTQGSLINKVLDSLPEVKTLEALRKLQSQVGEQTQNPEMWGLGKNLKNLLRDTEEGIVETKLGAESPELLNEHRAARSEYRKAMDVIDSLNDRLHVGKYAGPGSFLTKLSEMNPEDVLKRLSSKNDVGLLNLLKDQFPEVSQSIQNTFLNQALKQAASKAQPGEAINTKSLFNVISKWSPELKEFALPPGAAKQLDAIQALIEKLPNKMNTSGTAKTLDALWSHVPGGVGSLVSLITGHNPVLGYVLGQLGRYVGREIPDAMKLATLKFLGSDLPIHSGGFRALAEFVSHSMEASKMIQNGVKNIFKSGAQVLPQSMEVKEKDREKLKKRLDALQERPEEILDTGGDTNYYLPEHGTSFGAVAARATQYLNSLKPNTSPLGILDEKREPSSVEEFKYNRALDIAEQPLTVLKHIQNATLLPQDVITLKTIYPALYQSLNQKILDRVIDLKSKGESIPYSTRMALSIFTGQSLDSTMKPENIQATQPRLMQPTQPQMNAQGKYKGSMKALSELPGTFLTPQQARIQDKLQA